MAPRERGRGVENLIKMLHGAHLDNSTMQYVARRPRQSIPIMPLTPFVYEFFLFNSLYHVDWAAAAADGAVQEHPRGMWEGDQQRVFLDFVWDAIQGRPELLYRALEPLSFLPRAEGDWTRITPDARITKDRGRSFFRAVTELQRIVEACHEPQEMPVEPRVRELLDTAMDYVYRIRNNIFHGAKRLGEVYEPYHKRRIEACELVLKAITSLFFLSMGRSPVGSDLVECSLAAPVLGLDGEREVLSAFAILGAINAGVMKTGDSRLIARFTRAIVPPSSEPGERAALFYPSAGQDLLTPLLLGLPYCSQFFFYERFRGGGVPPILSVLRRMPGVQLAGDQSSWHWRRESSQDVMEFVFNVIPRKLHWVHEDNKDFLRRDVDLAFYFHRGDGSGEGGSGQAWDSELAGELVKKIPAGAMAPFLTDGVPGGFDRMMFGEASALQLHDLTRGRQYFVGRLRGSR